MSLLEAGNIFFSYRKGEKKILDNLSFHIDRGEFVSVLGPNGCGKSTLALILSGLLREDGGRFNLSLSERRNKCRIVFQNPDNQIIGETVEEDVAFGPENLNLEQKEIEERVEAALLAVSLIEKRESSPYALSGGERQREALSSVLALKPEVLILDEVTSMLDKRNRENILSLLHKETRERGLAVIHITHHTDEAVLSDRVCILSDGRIITEGKPRDVLKYPLLSSLSLYVPFAVEVSYKLSLGNSLTLTELEKKIKVEVERV